MAQVAAEYLTPWRTIYPPSGALPLRAARTDIRT
jgi:hypothetical protein